MNYEKQPDLKDRSGSDKDAENLKETFEVKLNSRRLSDASMARGAELTASSFVIRRSWSLERQQDDKGI